MTSGTLRAKSSTQDSGPGSRTSGHRSAAAHSKAASLEEQDQDQDQDELDPYQNWSTHSAEIAK